MAKTQTQTMPAQRRSSKRGATVPSTGAGKTPEAPRPTRAASEAPVRVAERPVKPTTERTADRAKAIASARRNLWARRTEGIRRMFRDIVAESRKINWPDQQTTRNLTIVVIGISVVLGALLGGIDFVLLKLIEVLP